MANERTLLSRWNAGRSWDEPSEYVHAALPEHAAAELVVSNGGVRASLTLLEARTRPFVLEGRSATAKDVLPSVDVALFHGANWVEQVLVLRDEAAPKTFRYAIPPNHRVRASGITFLDAKNAEVLRLAPPFAVDATGGRVEVEWRVADTTLTVRLPETTLAYPVLVDPLIEAIGWTRIPTLREVYRPAIAAFDGGYLMFGGWASGALDVDDTWQFDGSEWTLLNPRHAPSPRHGAAVANYQGKVLLFGGTQGLFNPHSLNDTWEWDGVDWTERFPARRPAFETSWSRMAGAGQRVLLVDSHDRWTWNGSDWQPELSSTALDFPSAISSFGQGALVLKQGELWLWNGSTWAQLPSPPLSGGELCEANSGIWLFQQVSSMATFFDGGTWSSPVRSPSDGTIACSGTGGILFASNTSVLDGGAWTIGIPSRTPALWNDHPVIAGLDGSIVLFDTGQTWTFDGRHWRRNSPLASPPMTNFRMTEFNGRVFLHHDDSQQPPYSWEWNGTDWTSLAVTGGQHPGHRWEPALTTWNGLVMLFSGQGPGGLLNDTWLWDGGSWQLADIDGSVPPVYGARIAPYDGGVLLFGNAFSIDVGTWTWDGAHWRRVNVTPSPPSTIGNSLAGLEGRVISFGGTAAQLQSDETWVWDGTGWSQWIGRAPPPRVRGAFAATSDHLTLYGGNANGGPASDVWNFRFHGLLGAPCASAPDCVSGFCVDGVCCSSSCGGGQPDCQACSVDAGAPSSGQCVLLSDVCRASRGACDPAERCTGSSPTCPADAIGVAGAVCRPSAGACDVSERCNGVSDICPTDRWLDAGVSCRAATCSTGISTAAEVCTGTSADCPPPARTPCEPFACGALVCKDSCTDESACAEGFACVGGSCRSPLPEGSSCLRDGQCSSGRCDVGRCCPSDAGCPTVDAGAPESDGGSGSDGGADAGPNGGGPTQPCSCSSGGLGAVLGLGALASLRGRRRRLSGH